MKIAKSKDDIPNGPHFAIIEFVPVTEYSGYENEGYINSPSMTTRYQYTEDQKEWENWIMVFTKVKPEYPFVAIQANLPTITTSVSIKVS